MLLEDDEIQKWMGEVFARFNSLCTSSQIGYLETGPTVKIWNKMMEAYFRARHSIGALHLLETMIDAESTDKTSKVFICPTLNS